MRLRLAISFSLVVVVAILSVVLFVRLDSEQQVTTYMFRGGAAGVENIVTSLEEYYDNNGGWAGVETVIMPGGMLGNTGGANTLHTPSATGRRQGGGGMGYGFMMNQRLRLVDITNRILVDTSGSGASGTVSSSELETAIVLNNKSGQKIGYLLTDSNSGFRQGDQWPLITRLNNVALEAGLLATAIALVLALLLSGQVLRPVQQLTRAAQTLAAGDLTHQVPIRGNDELATLGQAFNKMTDSLRKSEEQRRAMTADIAHELRTPLAVQRANLEALLDGIYPLTADNLQPILDQTNLLTRLVDDLRTLALADAGELRLEKTEVNFGEVLTGILDQFRSAAEMRQVTLVFSNPPDNSIIVEGDPDRLAQIMNNLLSNALRYTPEGGSITLKMIRTQEQVTLKVHDSGPGIPPEALPHLFERFYRADRSRSREKGGTGLGLAIARHLAAAHGGNLTASNHPQGGALFTLTLPTLKQST